MLQSIKSNSVFDKSICHREFSLQEKVIDFAIKNSQILPYLKNALINEWYKLIKILINLKKN